ncbi:hypothetical protein C4D60_Mb09t15830 [Musa balbisiana]|uniref:Major facilitator superfamily (MFS) profile domain-containing protein n=1 Tax=Musa balbisiana TaxID=52838 RepID=A0A4V4H3A1_MUSBA|nr:hypothetical protein C4D60_Mb09t15830 [Musa balbisiana]
MEAKEEGEMVVKPLMQRERGSSSPSSLWMVVASTAIAVFGSFEFGISVGYSSPSQSGIMHDLNLSLPQAMAVSDILCIIGWVSIFLTKDIMWLDLGRLSVGCGIGLLSYVLMICCGGSLAYLLGTVLTWRILAIIGTFPCLLQLLGLIFIPESPRWLAMVGKDHEFEAGLKRLRGEHSDVSQEAEEIMEFTVSLQKLPQSGMLDLFQKKYLHAVIVGVGLMVLQQFGGVNAICFYASEIFVSAGFSSGDTGMIAMAAVQISAAGTCIGCFLVGISFMLKGHEFSKELNTVLALAGILTYTGSFSLGMGGIPWIFPLNMKGTAGSLVTLVSWVGSWIISYTFNFLMMWSSAGTFFIFASICGLTVLFVERLVPETKGRTLEEIQASMSLILQ